jgi:FkbM family methyltransferase
MHVGHDTAFYLAKGFDVAAVEANPALVADAQQKFAREIADGRLRIFAVAIAEQRGTVSLAVAGRSSGYSSLSPVEVARAERRGVDFEYVDVPAVPFEDILAEVGIPYYLKVDIEGLDRLCVKALSAFSERPTYVSIESSIVNAERGLGFVEILDEVAELWKLGYRRFKYIKPDAFQRVARSSVGGLALRRACAGRPLQRSVRQGDDGPLGTDRADDPARLDAAPRTRARCARRPTLEASAGSPLQRLGAPGAPLAEGRRSWRATGEHLSATAAARVARTSVAASGWLFRPACPPGLPRLAACQAPVLSLWHD